MKYTLTTERLILRPWEESDAKSLYKYAKNPNVGPIAGWPVHQSEEDSLNVIKNVLSVDETYAVTLKDNDEPIGSIGLLIGKCSNIDIADNEGEIGYWMAEEFWGQGIMPEATKELIRHGFEDLNLQKIWCGYFDGNEKSHRVQDKCGFKYVRTDVDKPWPLMNTVKTEHITCITKEDWNK